MINLVKNSVVVDVEKGVKDEANGVLALLSEFCIMESIDGRFSVQSVRTDVYGYGADHRIRVYDGELADCLSVLSGDFRAPSGFVWSVWETDSCGAVVSSMHFRELKNALRCEYCHFHNMPWLVSELKHVED